MTPSAYKQKANLASSPTFAIASKKSKFKNDAGSAPKNKKSTNIPLFHHSTIPFVARTQSSLINPPNLRRQSLDQKPSIPIFLDFGFLIGGLGIFCRGANCEKKLRSGLVRLLGTVERCRRWKNVEKAGRRWNPPPSEALPPSSGALWRTGIVRRDS